MAVVDIQRNARVLAEEGKFGRVKHVIVDHDTREVTDLVVQHGEDEYLVPMSHVARVDGNTVMLTGRGADFGGLPPFDPDAFHAVDEERVRAESTRQAMHGGAPLLHADGNKVQVRAEGGREAVPVPPSARAEDYVEQPPAVVHEDIVPTPVAEPVATTTQGQTPFRLQLKSERLEAHTRAEEVGHVQLGKRLVEHAETLTVPVREERVIIERRPVAGAPAQRPVGADLQPLDVPVMRERVEVSKVAVVREEVTVRKETIEHTEQVQDTVREEQLELRDGQQFVREEAPAPPAAPDNQTPGTP